MGQTLFAGTCPRQKAVVLIVGNNFQRGHVPAKKMADNLENTFSGETSPPKVCIITRKITFSGDMSPPQGCHAGRFDQTNIVHGGSVGPTCHRQKSGTSPPKVYSVGLCPRHFRRGHVPAERFGRGEVPAESEGMSPLKAAVVVVHVHPT